LRARSKILAARSRRKDLRFFVSRLIALLGSPKISKQQQREQKNFL